MRYKTIQTEQEYLQVIEMCKECNIETPLISNKNKLFPDVTIIAVDETGEVKSFGTLKTETWIEPFISTNPSASVKVMNMLEGIALGRGIDEVLLRIDDKNTEMLEKFGYKFVDSDKTIMRKEF